MEPTDVLASRDHAIEHTPVRHGRGRFKFRSMISGGHFLDIAYSDRSSATAHLSPQTAAEWDHPLANEQPVVDRCVSSARGALPAI